MILCRDGFVGDDPTSQLNAREMACVNFVAGGEHMDNWFFAGVLIAAAAVISLFFFLPPGPAVVVLLVILIVLLLLLGNKGLTHL